MNDPAESRTLTVTIRRSADDVYDFVSQVENFPEWSAFARGVKREGSEWIFETSAGPMRVRFAARNKLRVWDHYVTDSSRWTTYVPARVVANGPNASEVIFTLYRAPGVSDEKYAADADAVLADLNSLKRMLESAPSDEENSAAHSSSGAAES